MAVPSHAWKALGSAKARISAVARPSPALMEGKEQNAARGPPARRSDVAPSMSSWSVVVLTHTLEPSTPSGSSDSSR